MADADADYTVCEHSAGVRATKPLQQGQLIEVAHCILVSRQEYQQYSRSVPCCCTAAGAIVMSIRRRHCIRSLRLVLEAHMINDDVLMSLTI